MRLSAAFPVIGLTAAVAIVLASCGGGKEATPAPSPAPPRATAPPVATPTSPAAVSPTAVPSPTARPTATPIPATPTPAAPAPKLGGTFRMRISGPYAENWNNYSEAGQFSVVITQNILNNLAYLDPNDGLTPRPDLAEQWSIAPDGKTVTWALRKDVKWHDGTPFTSRDALNSLNLAKAPVNNVSSLHSVRLRIVDKFDAPDDYTIRATLAQPSASFMTIMSIPSMLIFPAHVQGVPQDWKANGAIGTGPFKFKNHRVGVVMELTRNPAYFRKDARGQTLPYMDGFEAQFITDRALSLSAFRTGKLDCACSYTTDVTVTDLDSVKKDVPNIRLGTTPSTMTYLLFNSRPPFDNVKVRQAFSAGVDRKQVQETYRLGQGLYPPTFFTPEDFGGKLTLPNRELLNTPGFRLKDGKKDPADTALSKQLFAEAGIDSNNLRFKFVSSSGAFDDLNELLLTLFQGMGFKVTAEFLQSVEQAKTRAQGNFDVSIDPANNAFEDPLDVLIPNTVTGGPRNWGKWSFPKIDDLAARQERELDPVKRADLVKQLQREVLDTVIYTPLLHLASIYAVQPYVEGFVLNRAYNVTSAHKLDAVWLNK